MNHRMHLVALSANALILGLLLAGCGDYGDSDDDPAAGGSTGVGGDAAGVGGDAAGVGGDTTAMGGMQSGTGGGAATCTNVTPCGGDLVGTWNVTSSCLDVSGEANMMGFGLGCTSAPVTGTLQVTGTYAINADGTVTDNTTTTGTETLDLPSSCLSVSGTCTGCSRIGGPLASVGYASADCVDNPNGEPGECGTGCTCTAIVNQSGGMGLVSSNAAATGNYTVAGSDLTTTPGDLQYSYCASGTTLSITPVSESPKVTTGSIELSR